MPQSLARIVIHLVFSTKNRQPWLKDKGIREELYAYMATVMKSIDCPAIVINGVEDHVHLLFSLSRNIAVKDVAANVKAHPSKWIKSKGPRYGDFYWQAGYGAFSVSESNVDSVRTYIVSQERHHRQMSFQDEFRRICAKHGVEVDEQFAWD